jgi:hypothetical protein
VIRITVYAGPSLDPAETHYEPSVTERTVDESDVSETLRQLGLEWRQADYFSGRQTVITLDPVVTRPDVRDVRDEVRNAAEALERTGLL